MSGGYFGYKQDAIARIELAVRRLIDRGIDRGDYSPETIAEFRAAESILQTAHVYTQRIDWLVSGDDGEETFHERLKHDLKALTDEEKK